MQVYVGKKPHVYRVIILKQVADHTNYTVSKKPPSCTMELKSNSESSMSAKAALISSKIWFLFIALTVVVVVGSPTTDLLESVDCLLRDCVRYFKNASLEAFYYFPSILTDFNSLLPAPLSLVLLHFNCDFHGYLTRSRSTCIKCPPGINLLLVLKP